MPRQRTYLNGKLVHRDGAFTHDCTIRDISEGGARITLATRELLPADLYLIIVHRCLAYQARIVWQNYPARGLQFLGKHVLAETLPKEFAFLQHIWGGLSARVGPFAEVAPWTPRQIEALRDSTY